MAADAEGNDIDAVPIPVTGNLGIAALGTTLPTAVEGADPDFILPVAFTKVGLLTEDGGPQWAWAPDGDPIVFWQEGYSIPSGLANVTVVAKFAQVDDFTRSVIYGDDPDANGYIEVDGGGHSTEYVLFTEEQMKSGAIRRRIAPKVGVLSVTEDPSARGAVHGVQVTFEVKRSTDLSNKHFAEWWLPADSGS